MSANAVVTGPVFDSWWLGPYRESRPIQQTAALDLLLAVVEEGVSVRVVASKLFFAFSFIMVSKFQNGFMKSSFLPKYEPKIVRISAL